MKNSAPKKKQAEKLQAFCATILDKLNPEQKALLDEYNKIPASTKRFSESRHEWWKTT